MNGRARGTRRSGVTLLELLVVLSVAAVLAALLAPVWKTVAAASRGTACLANERAIGVGILAYAAENRQALPPCLKASQPWYAAIAPYIAVSSKVYHCPGHQATAPAWLSYGYNLKFGLVDKDGHRLVQSDPGLYEIHNLLRFIDRSRTTMLIDLAHAPGTPNFNGGAGPVFYYDGSAGADFRHGDRMNVLWVDGHASAISRTEAADWKGARPEWNGTRNYNP